MHLPYLYAIGASIYIATIAFVIINAPHFESEPSISVLGPIVMLSLLVLSVALMGFLFFYQPLNLYMDGKRAEAVRFFVRTISTFALITLSFLAYLYFTTPTV